MIINQSSVCLLSSESTDYYFAHLKHLVWEISSSSLVNVGSIDTCNYSNSWLSTLDAAMATQSQSLRQFSCGMSI